MAPLSVLLGGVLLHSMNVLMVATVLPSIVADLGGAALMSWPTTAYLGASIVAAACTGLVSARLGPARTFFTGATIFAAGTLTCALAPGMLEVIAGRFVQGFGGGLLSAVAYVLVRRTFPELLWPRVFALLAGVWSVSVLLGPLMGGAFAALGDWRGAFFAVAGLAAVVALFGARVLRAPRVPVTQALPRVPVGRVLLICVAIVVLSLAAVMEAPAWRLICLVLALAALAAVLRLDRGKPDALLPSDAFSVRSLSGVGLWVALLVSVAFAPLQIYVPAFLQQLHGFDPLGAGYMVAGASLAWTLAAIAVSGLTEPWPSRFIVVGPALMGTGLLGIALLMPGGSSAGVLLAIVAVGAGIGSCWAFTAQRVMSAARPGDENVSASAVATVQQTGVAVGAALAGLLANVAGFSVTNDHAGMAQAARWMPAGFVLVAAAGCFMGVHLGRLGGARAQ